jgi:hypothetical protein
VPRSSQSIVMAQVFKRFASLVRWMEGGEQLGYCSLTL